MVVSIHTNTPFVCIWGGGGATEQVCACIYMQYDPRTHWRTGEKRAYRAVAKSAAGRAYDNDAFFHFPSTLWGIIHVDGGVIWPWYRISIIIWRHTSDCDIYIHIYIHVYLHIYMYIFTHTYIWYSRKQWGIIYMCAHKYTHISYSRKWWCEIYTHTYINVCTIFRYWLGFMTAFAMTSCSSRSTQ